MKNIIIGAGPAGRLAGLELGRLGEEVILIEKEKLGGTCLNEGCMVVCALTDITRFLNDASHYKSLNLMKGDIEFSYEEIVKKIKKTQEIIHKIDHAENTSNNNEIIYGEAKINDNEVKVNGESFNYKNLLIATGANPHTPNIKGVEYSINNKDILKLKKVPEKLNIIGGSIIAAEISNIYSSLGSEVNVIARSEFLKELDPEIKEYIVKKLLKNVKIHEKTEPLEIQKNKTIVKNKDEKVIEMEGLTFSATGRSPNSKILENILEPNQFDKKGAIKVNEMMQTNVKNIYAAGDVIGGLNLTPVARMQGILAARNMAGYFNKIEYKCIPQSIRLEMDVSFVKNIEHKNSAINTKNNTDNIDNINYNNTNNINNDKNDINNSTDNVNVNKSEKLNEVSVPGSAGPRAFWKVLTNETGMTKASFNSKELLESITAISPSSVNDIAYLSYLMRINENIENFDEFIEIHPSTDVFFQIMKYM